MFHRNLLRWVFCTFWACRMFLKQTEKQKQKGYFKALLPTIVRLKKIRKKIKHSGKKLSILSEHSNANVKKRMNE